ncbi:MAG: acyltransferase family protein [Wenzhouxiangellaceae bacterium]
MPATDRDLYLDALRAGALVVVVLGHWAATLPRMDDGVMVEAEHLLKLWEAAGYLTWLVQVVPLFIFVSAAVSADGVERRMRAGHRQLHWWAGRSLALARPTVTYLAVLAAFALLTVFTGGRLLDQLNESLTIHLWFLLMLITVQALLPASVEADRKFGLWAIAGLIAITALVDWLRAGLPGPSGIPGLGERVMAADSLAALLIGSVNAFAVWLLPQQLGIAWRRKRFHGAAVGAALIGLGLVWLLATIASGYPVGMVGVDFAGHSNMLPPTLALIGVMWLQIGLVLLLEKPARWLIERRHVAGAVTVLSALGMPLYLWHKFAELPAAWLGERLGLPIDAGIPGTPGFWAGRGWWLLLCLAMVIPVIAAVAAFEARRSRQVAAAGSPRAIIIGGISLYAGLTISLALGAIPGAIIGTVLVLVASQVLRQHPRFSGSRRAGKAS